MISIKTIKDMLIDGTNINFNHGEFAKLIIGDYFFEESEFNDIIKNNNTFGAFLRDGNLREVQGKDDNKYYLYALPKINKKLKRWEDENGSLSVLQGISESFDSLLSEKIYKVCLRSAYQEGVIQRIKQIITPENTYYVEAVELLNEMINSSKTLTDALALLTLIAIFQDNIIELYPDKFITKCHNITFFPHTNNKQKNKRNSNQSILTSVDTNQSSTKFFFTEGIQNLSIQNISEVNLAFHSGSEWKTDIDKIEILSFLIRNNIKIKVILNLSDVIQTVCNGMSHPMKKYTGFNESALEWFEQAQSYPDTIEVRYSSLPLLHRLYIIKGNDSNGWVNVKYYTYGNYNPENDYRSTWDYNNKYYNLYLNEFDYLWENACTILTKEKILSVCNNSISILRLPKHSINYSQIFSINRTFQPNSDYYIESLLDFWTDECRKKSGYDEKILFILERIPFVQCFGNNSYIVKWLDNIMELFKDYDIFDIKDSEDKSILNFSGSLVECIINYTRLLVSNHNYNEYDLNEIIDDFLALDYSSLEQVNPLISICYFDYLGLVYKQMFQITKNTEFLLESKKSFEKSIIYAEQVDTKTQIWTGYISFNYARVLKELKEFNAATEYYKKSICIRRKWKRFSDYHEVIKSSFSFEYFITLIDYINMDNIYEFNSGKDEHKKNIMILKNDISNFIKQNSKCEFSLLRDKIIHWLTKHESITDEILDILNNTINYN